MPNRIAIEYFAGVERLLAAEYGLVGSRHSSDKGETREDVLTGVLNNHLPSTAHAFRGGQILFVSDDRSQQVDIVVYSSHAPRLGQSRKALFFAEGVYAAIEQRSVFKLDMIPAFLRWSRRIKRAPKVVKDPAEERLTELSWPTMLTGLFAYETRCHSFEALAERLAKAAVSEAVLDWELPDFITFNGRMTLFKVGSTELDDLPFTPDVVVSSSDSQINLVGFRASFAFLMMHLVATIRSKQRAVLDMLRYLEPRAENARSLQLFDDLLGDIANRRPK